MVSLNDAATAQIQVSSLKQDAAEAAFKARHSFNSSDAFKQIFDGIDKSPAPSARSKESIDAEPVKHEHVKRSHEHKGDHKTDRKDDRIEKSCDEDKAASEAEVKKIGAQKHDKVKVSKKDKADDNSADNSDKECDDDATSACSASTDVSGNTSHAADSKESTDITLDTTNTGMCVGADTQSGTDEQESAEADTTEDTANTGTQTSEQQPKVNVASILVANLHHKLDETFLNMEGLAANTSQSQVLDFQKSTSLHEKTALQKADKNDSSATADDAFAAALDVDAKLAKDAQAKDTQENAKTERAATKEATQKHDDLLDLLQGKFSANATPPAAGDRAISVAVKAADSSAPTLNGSAGSGSPIAPNGDSEAAAITGLEGLRHGRALPPQSEASFAATLRGTKDAHASLMVPSEQIAVNLHRMAKSGSSQYEMQLHPAELGRVDIKLDITKDGLVHATISADNQQAFDMLQKDSRSLERALQQAGLQTDDNSLSFTLRDGSNQAQQQQAQQNSGNAWNKWMDKTLPDEPVPSKVLTYDITGANSRVDLRV